ncbi:MAG: ATP synthase F1 subunit gamma, partial [Vicinamibacteria bacterium]
NLLDLRRRVRSIKNTQQITKAMKMVSAAKLRRAQDRILSARPFALKMLEVLNSLATRADPKAHPLLVVREPQRVEVVVITADKGLAGAFNANILKEAMSFLEKENAGALELQVVGRKARDFFRRRDFTIRSEYVDIFRDLTYEHCREVAGPIMERYMEGSLDAVYVIYNQFKNVMQQDVVAERLLPLEKLRFERPEEQFDYIYEPTAKEILADLLPTHVEYQVWRALLESAAAEHAARMTAMDSATKNASELIDHLTLTMNRVRQASITNEILEVVSGVEALK